jgi:hypothetical protein
MGKSPVMKANRIVGSILFLFIFLFQLQAQQFRGIVRGMFVEVDTKDGMYLLGTVESISDEVITLTHETYTEISIRTLRIKSIRQIDKENVKQEEYWHENKNYSRNYYGPTGIGLEKGNGYYQNIMLVWNHLAYSFSDYFTLGIDFEIVSILSRLSGEPIFEDNPMPVTALTPKFSFQTSEKTHLGFGAIGLFVPGTDYYIDAGIGYGVFTYGDKNRNGTLGFGLPYFEGGFELKSQIVTLSGQYRLSPKISLLSENWLLFFREGNGINDDSQTIYIGVQGMRYLARELTWDFGIALLGVSGEDTFFFPVPYISVVFPFEKPLN